MSNGLFGSGSGSLVLALGLILCAAAGYFLGSVNSAIIVSKLKFGQDIRKFGSGNAGMTNMLRTYGKGAAGLTLLGDVLKTVIGCLIGLFLLGESGGYVAGFFCIIGHVFPIYYGFKGGKGVLALATMVCVLNWQTFLVLFTLFVLIVSCTKYISLGSVMCALLYPIVLSKFAEPNIFATVVSMIVAILVTVMHRSNIKRLLDGEENKLKLGKEPVKTWKLVVLNAVIVCITLGAILLDITSSSGMTERKNPAVSYGDYYISELQLRYMYVKTADDFLSDPANAEADIVKNYDKTKKLDEQSINGQTYAEYFMDIATDEASRLMILFAEAKKAGVEVSPTDDRCLAEFSEMSKNFIQGDSYGRYINRTYGKGVGESDIRNIIISQFTVEDYIRSVGEKTADDAVKNNLSSVQIDKEDTEKIINGDYK